MPYTLSIHQTSWGFVAAAWSEAGLWELTFPFACPELAVEKLAAETVSAAAGEAGALLDRELKAYFDGNSSIFATPVDWSGYTPFRADVLRYTAAIPYGELRTYGEAAAAAGSPKAARAAGGALHNNRTPIIVPCHRVVGSSGKLVGFGGGLDLKTALLKLESGGR